MLWLSISLNTYPDGDVLPTLFSLKLKAFGKFENTTDAMQAVTGIVEGKMPKNLKKFLSGEISEADMKKEKLIVSDAKLGELFRPARHQWWGPFFVWTRTPYTLFSSLASLSRK